MKNNKGFTLVELLATVLILGILSVAALIAYTSYLTSTRNKAYDTMARSAANAASEYGMDYYGVDSVTFKELYEDQYLEYPQDPSSSGKMCTGKVYIHRNENIDAIETEEYDVIVCCANFSYKYHFPGGKKTKVKTVSKTKPKEEDNENSSDETIDDSNDDSNENTDTTVDDEDSDDSTDDGEDSDDSTDDGEDDTIQERNEDAEEEPVEDTCPIIE